MTKFLILHQYERRFTMKSIIKSSTQLVLCVLLLAAQMELFHQGIWYLDDVIYVVNIANPCYWLCCWTVSLVTVALLVVSPVSLVFSAQDDDKNLSKKRLFATLSCVLSAVGALVSLVQLLFSLFNMSATAPLYPTYTLVTILLEALSFVGFIVIGWAGRRLHELAS
jgi:hypothetical protein